MPAYSVFKSYVSRLHDALHVRRAKKQPKRPVIEDSMGILPDASADELYILREKAAASVVGSAFFAGPDTDGDVHRVGPALHGLHMHPSSMPQLRHASRSTPSMALAPAPSLHCCRRCRSTRDILTATSSPMSAGVMSYAPVVLVSTEPYAPSGLSVPSSASSASSASSIVLRD